ncbi:hypothetical protein GK109_14425 [Pseudarthrobacter sp. GA104]|nr:hypothetical protein [Pseudarthrobacter sp. GA104]
MRSTQGRLAWLVAAITALLIVTLVVVLVPMMQSGNPGSAAPVPASPTSLAPTPEQPLPPAPAVTYYSQAGPPSGSPQVPVEALSVTVGRDRTGTSLPEGIVGLSLEATDLADTSLRGDNPEMVGLLTGLGKAHIRFGGSSVDRRMFWTSTGEPVPSNLKGDKPRPVRAVTPADFQRVNTLLVAADAQISLTVDLGNFDPARAGDMAKYGAEIFGARLVSITVGNEPNGFPTSGVRPSGWGLKDYLGELEQYADAIHKMAPDVPLLGPGAYSEAWWEPFVKTSTPQQKILSLHHYPLTSCDSKDPDSAPTMANLVSARMHERTLAYQRAALDVARQAGMQVWIPETGVSACDGANPTSRTHASALWSVDYVLSSAQNGIQRLGFHSSLLTCTGGPPLSPICSGGAYLKPNGTMTKRAPYLGLAMAASLGSGDFLKVEQSGGGLTYAYALEQADGSTSIIIVNENDPESSAQVEVNLTLPGRARTGTMTRLTGSSFGSQDGTRIDGAEAIPAPVAARATVEGFNYGSPTQKFKLTAGTATVLNFKY